MNRYSWWTPDFQHEYFMLRINNRETAGYAIYDEKSKRVDNNRQFADGYETAEEARQTARQKTKKRVRRGERILRRTQTKEHN